ncbi:MAG: hypothetical protein JXR95_16320 [Deltaproteobacteria bacterium]|nr:hypothetical protein [Deltaproteobacteria bacterium]
MLNKILLIASCSVLIFSSTSNAQRRKNRASKDVKHDSSRKITYKADKSLNMTKEEAIAKAKADAAKGKTEIKYEDFIQRAKKAQDAKLPILKSLIRQNRRQLRIIRANDKRAREYKFRIADAFLQLEQIYKFKLGETIEKASTATGATKTKLLKRKALYMRGQKKYIEEALKELNDISTNPNYADWNRMDEVLFKLGDIARELGYQDIMKDKFQKLLSRYPTSKFVPHVYLAFAEYYFRKGRTGLTRATAYFKKVVANKAAKNTGIYFYARRMLGWCYFNLQQYPLAQSEFLFVAKNAKRKALKSSARREVVMAYSFQGKKELAYNFFRGQLGQNFARPLYLQLAKEYFAQGNMPSMIWVYEDMIKKFPKDHARCEWFREIYLGYKLDQAVEKMADTLTNIVKTMDSLKAQLGEKKMQYMVCRDFTKRALIDQAKRWFSLVEKGKAKELDEQKKLMINAAKLYKGFLDKFPNDDDTYEMRGDYAYLLYRLAQIYEEETRGKNENEQRERYKFAAMEYTKLLKWDRKPKSMTQSQFEKQREQIGNDTVAAWMKVLAVDFNKEEKSRNKKAQDYIKRRNCLKAKKKAEDSGRKWRRKCPTFEKNLDIPAQLKSVIEVFDLYTKYVKGGKYLGTIKYNRAMIYYIYRHFNKAIPLFKDTALSSYKENPQMAYWSVNFMMIAYDAEDRFSDMVETITELLKPQYNVMFNIDDKARKLRAQLEKAKLENLENEVAKRGEEGRYVDAGELLMEMASQYKSDPERVIRYYNSAYIAFEKAGQIGRAIRSLRQMQAEYASSYKKNKSIVDANLKIGNLFEKIAMFEYAAKSYEAFFKSYPRDPDAVKAARRAIKLYWWSGQIKKAEAKNREFITRLNNMGARQFMGDMASMYFMLHSFYEGKKVAKVQEYLSFFTQKMSRAGTDDLLIRAYSKLGKILWDSSCPVKPKYGVCMRIVYVTKKSKTDTWKEAVVKFVPRKRGVVRAAVNQFNQAVRIYNRWKGGKSTKGSVDATDKKNRVNSCLNDVAMAKFHLAEANYEEIISAEIPMLKAKNAKEVARSLKDIKSWMGKQSKLMLKVKKLYEEVGKITLSKKKKNEWYIPAAGRFGAIYKNFYTKVNNIKFGKELEKNITAKLEFKDTLSNAVEPMLDIAKNGFQACVKQAKRSGRYDEWFEFCENELAVLKRSVSPLSDEVWAKPAYEEPELSKATIMPVPSR